jgi:hypothetical protein
MHLNIKIPYEICKVDNGNTQVVDIVAGSPLEAMWQAYRLCVTMKTYAEFSEWQRDFDEQTASMKIERLKKIKYIKSKSSGKSIYTSHFLQS